MSESESIIRKGESIDSIVNELKQVFMSFSKLISTEYYFLPSLYKRYVTKRMLEKMYSNQIKTILKELSFNPYGPFLIYVNEVDREPFAISIIEKIRKWRSEVVSINFDPLHFKIPKQRASKYQYAFIINIEKNDAIWANIKRLFGLLKTFGISKERTVIFLTRRHYILERIVGKIFKIPLPSEKTIEECILSLNSHISKSLAREAAKILVGHSARLIIDSLIATMEDLGYRIEC